MFKEQIKYIKAYFKVAEVNKWLFALNAVTAVLYKATAIIRPIIAALIIRALTEQNAGEAYLFIFVYLGVYLFYRLMLFLNWRSYSWNVIWCYYALQDKLFNKLISVDNNFAHKINKGRLMNVINSDLYEIGEMNDEISEFFTTILQIAGVIAISASQSLSVSLVMIISILIYSRVRTVHDRKFNFYWWRSQAENDNYSNFLGQVLTGLQEVKTFNMLSSLHGHLDNIQRRYDKNYKRQRHHLAPRDNDVRFVIYFFRALVLLICIYLVATRGMTIDVLVLIYSYHQALFGYVKDFTDATIDIRQQNASVRRVNSILNYHSDKQSDFGDLDLDHISGALSFKNVSLTLNKQPILRSLSFRVKPHEFVAIVGYPGSGKTKLFDLILRINRPTKGKISLDGININDFSKEIYTSNVAVANQVPFIFNTSIRKNLNFVDTDIKHQIEACKTAGIHDFIESLPMGYNTILRENGGNISGGQRQMISIARTILTNAEVLLLDDVTTSLDPDTAKLVPALVKRLRHKHTVIMITKKPDLMKSADRIIVLDKGKISDIGTHEKLLERSKLYRSLQTLQSDPLGGQGGQL